ncbi:MAG: hypothetical protein MZV63_33470 [Marinilabiliales bacterium]|nr:hypothetical protein [Marinilabiliales bacterium]
MAAATRRRPRPRAGVGLRRRGGRHQHLAGRGGPDFGTMASAPGSWAACTAPSTSRPLLGLQPELLYVRKGAKLFSTDVSRSAASTVRRLRHQRSTWTTSRCRSSCASRCRVAERRWRCGCWPGRWRRSRWTRS